MKWFTETIITLTPLSLTVLLFAALCLGWIIYGLRGYKYWWKRFHHYKTIPSRRQMKRNYGYVEYVPEVMRQAPAIIPLPQKRPPQVIYKQVPTVAEPKNIPAAPAPTQHLSQKDDLQVVEGIGPKIEEILNKNGIYTWRNLYQTPVVTIKTMLGNAGKRFQMHDPKTWPEQANMADTGKWDDLKEYQDFLYKGRE
jgi:predicted flap endonuclease-1-like 5' DNA nuclease